MSSRTQWKGKRIAVIGLGAHGEMMADIRFLIKSGALVTLYEMRSEARLKQEIVYLQSIGLAGQVCGSVPAEDLLDVDLIILSHDYDRNSLFLGPAQRAGIPIEFAETLFFKMAPPLMFVGILGSCGKTTVMSMIAPMLEKVTKKANQNFFLIDPDSDKGCLSFLKKIGPTDVLLMRITESLAKELSRMRISPHVAIFTTAMMPGYYEKMPFEILSYQTYNNFIIASDEVIDETHRTGFQPKAKMLRTKDSLVPEDLIFAGRGKHDKSNAALAIQTAKLFKIDDDEIRESLEEWKPLKGRLELVKKVRSVDFYNDTASQSAESTISALTSMQSESRVILIFGGAETKSDYRSLYSILPKYVRTLVLLPGSGTMKERGKINKLDHLITISATSIEDAVTLALEQANKGDRVIFSPGFVAGGFDRSRKERGERYVRAVRALK